MFGSNFGSNFKVVRVQNAAVAGTSNLVGSTVDTDGFDSIAFLYGVGTVSASSTAKLKAGGGVLANGSDASDFANSGTPAGASTYIVPTTDSNKTVVLDIIRPTFRYVTPTLVRGTGNCVVDGGWALLYNTGKPPITPDATIASAPAGQRVIISPALGTAN